MTQDYIKILSHTDNLSWCGLVTTGRAGSDFFQSLLDSHPEIFVFNGILNFNKYWKDSFCVKSKQMIEAEDIAYEFIGHYIHKLKSKYDYVERKDQLGNNGDDSINIDVVEFHTHFTELLKLQEINYRNVLKAVYIAYALTLNQSIEEKKVFFHHVHHMWILDIYLKHFPDSKIISMTRDPRASFVSGVKHWQKHNPELDHLRHVYFVLNRTLEDAIILKNEKNDYQVLKIEDLGQEEILTSICDWLNIHYDVCMMQSTWAGKRWWGDKLSVSNVGKNEIGFSKNILKNNWENELGWTDKYVLNYLLCDRLEHLSYEYTKVKIKDHILAMILIVLPTRYEKKYLSPKYLFKCFRDKKYSWIAYSFYYYIKRILLFYKIAIFKNINRYDLPYFRIG